MNNSKTREGRELKKQLNERLGELKALLDVEKFTNQRTDDPSEHSLDDDLSSVGLFDDDEVISSAVKRKRLSTLAEVTVGTATLGKLVTEKPVDFVGFDNVVEFNKNRQNDDNVVKAYKGLFS